MAPRHTHYRSVALVRRMLDTQGVAHHVKYGKRDNALIVIDGKEVPVFTSRFNMLTGELFPPVGRAKAQYGRVFAADPDENVVSEYLLEDCTTTTVRPSGETLKTEMRSVWVAVNTSEVG